MDICKRNHGGNAESNTAYESIKPTMTQSQDNIYRLIDSKGYEGITSKELCKGYYLQMNAISGRITELKRDGRVFKKTFMNNVIRRDGAAVLISDNYNMDM